MQDSVFTKIIKGEIPSHKIYEDDKTIAFMDIKPVTPGHVVVAPKVQVSTVWDLEKPDYQALMETVQKVGRRLHEVFPDKKKVGATVEGLGVNDHAHVNVFTFDSSVEFRHIPGSLEEPDHDALGEMAEKLKLPGKELSL